jgi:hypothetical protein
MALEVCMNRNGYVSQREKSYFCTVSLWPKKIGYKIDKILPLKVDFIEKRKSKDEHM